MLSRSLPYPASHSHPTDTLLSVIAVVSSALALLTSTGWLAAVAFVAVLLLALKERIQPKAGQMQHRESYRTAAVPDGGATASLKGLRKASRDA